MCGDLSGDENYKHCPQILVKYLQIPLLVIYALVKETLIHTYIYLIQCVFC